MGKRRYRRKKASLEARIKEHREKIAQEQWKAAPDVGLIHHWEREIAAFQSGRAQTQWYYAAEWQRQWDQLLLLQEAKSHPLVFLRLGLWGYEPFEVCDQEWDVCMQDLPKDVEIHRVITMNQSVP